MTPALCVSCPLLSLARRHAQTLGPVMDQLKVLEEVLKALDDVIASPCPIEVRSSRRREHPRCEHRTQAGVLLLARPQVVGEHCRSACTYTKDVTKVRFSKASLFEIRAAPLLPLCGCAYQGPISGSAATRAKHLSTTCCHRPLQFFKASQRISGHCCR